MKQLSIDDIYNLMTHAVSEYHKKKEKYEERVAFMERNRYEETTQDADYLANKHGNGARWFREEAMMYSAIIQAHESRLRIKDRSK